MGILSQYEPKKVLEIFEEICAVPHGSGNRQPICDYCKKFASDRGLEHYQDEGDNVVIIKEATPGYEDAETIILQGHSDMVCVKTNDSDIDFLTDGLKISVDGDWIYAENTSLGADNGIAVAMMLAVLDRDDIPHPRLEIVITSDEEIGLDGAKLLNFSKLKGRKLINIDSEEEGYITVSCAGGARVLSSLGITREITDGIVCDLSITGLKGGHSGVEIDKGRGNSNSLLGRVLNDISKKVSFRLVSANGGTADNVITSSTFAKVIVAEKDYDALCAAVSESDTVLKKEYMTADPGITITCEKTGETSANAVTNEDTKKIIYVLMVIPQGIQAMSMDIPGLVQTSLNMGILELGEDKMSVTDSIRSSVATQKHAVIDKLRFIMEQIGGTVTVYNEYDAWEYQKDSALRQLCMDVYKEQYGRDAEIIATHGGLECGIFCGKAPDLDCVSIGPNIEGAHTVKERASISSIERVWKYICEILKRCK